MRRIGNLVLAAALALAAGCSTRTASNTPRTAVEQLLISEAVDLTLKKFKLPELRGKRVYVDLANLKAIDGEYVKVAVRARFAELGAILATSPGEAEYVAEIASGCLGTEYKNSVVGMPPLPVPSSPIPLPEVSLFRKVEQTAILKLLIFIHRKGRFVACARYFAKADRDEGFIMWTRFQKKDQVREGWERADAELEAKGKLPPLDE